jgi:hypothetical protein
MKKLTIVALIMFGAIMANAQDKKVRLGLKVSPSLAWNRINSQSNTVDTKGDGVRAKFGLGVIVDYYLGENYALGFGVNYATKGAGFTFNNPSLGSGTINYKLQYIELPVTLKLFTNEISDDLILYFQVGGSLNANIQSKGTYEYVNPGMGINTKIVTSYSGGQNKIMLPEVSGLFSAGVEKKMSENTIIMFGATYNRGLTNVIRTSKPPLVGLGLDGVKLINDYVSIDLGLKF